jgi:hypothetical protein
MGDIIGLIIGIAVVFLFVWWATGSNDGRWK